MNAILEGVKAKSKAYLAYRAGIKDGRNAPDMIGLDTWLAFEHFAATRYGALADTYKQGFDEGYNS